MRSRSRSSRPRLPCSRASLERRVRSASHHLASAGRTSHPLLNLQLRVTRRCRLLKSKGTKPSHAPNTTVYYNTPNIYAGGPDGDAPEHPFAQLPPTPVKRKRGRPIGKKRKAKEAKEKVNNRAEQEHIAAALAVEQEHAQSEASTTGAKNPGDVSPPEVGEEEAEAEFTDGEEGESELDETEEEDMDDPDDEDFVEPAALVPTSGPALVGPASTIIPPSSPASQATVVPDESKATKKASDQSQSGSPAPVGDHPPSTSDVSDSSGEEDDPSSDRDPDSDFDPTEDLYLPIRDVPHPGPPPDSPPRFGAGASAATVASPARTTMGRPGVPASPLANVDKTEVVDLLKLLLAKMNGGASASSPAS